MQKILITGGAGFIGSNIVKKLLELNTTKKVVILDNLSTGSINNITPFINDSRVEFIEGDIRNYKTCNEASKNIDAILHQAALGSVPRSINDPITTNEVNISGTLNIFYAAKENNVNKVVYAASSSTYGDSKRLPKTEENIGKPLSPYAVTKYVNELYADVFHKTYGINFIGLRYFNVFGPNQSPTGAYAAVIPLFIQAVINNKAPTINGDGSQTRDFTFVENAVQANILSLSTTNQSSWNQVYNIAVGERTSLLDLFKYIKEVSGSNIVPHFGPNRKGDIQDSLADISKAQLLLNYDPKIKLKEGLKMTYDWFTKEFANT